MSPDYPTEQQLDAIKSYEGYIGGITSLIEAAYNQHYGAITLGYGYNPLRRRVRRLVLVTGGWSGNESVIQALMENNLWWMLCWQSSERGGRYVFEWSEADNQGSRKK